jgi:hypothetical protein
VIPKEQILGLIQKEKESRENIAASSVKLYKFKVAESVKREEKLKKMLKDQHGVVMTEDRTRQSSSIVSSER